MSDYICREPGCHGDLICARVAPGDGIYDCGHDALAWRMYCADCAVVVYEPIPRCPHCTGLRSHDVE